jgi:hypothetical protein
MANKNLKSVEIKSCYLYDVGGEKYDMSAAVNGFSYYESIFKPFVTGVMSVTDSGSNFISTLPIQGGELVSITIKDVEEEEFTYNLHVWKVYGRIFTKGLQTYNLALISKEALYNEGVRLTKKLSGTPDSIVKKILEESLNTSKDVSTETCKYEVNFFPNGKKAHIIIQSLAQKALPNTSGKAKSTVGKTTTGGKSELSGDTKKSSGTAGYLFFENRNGFHFKSIDYYYSTGNDTFKGDSEVATYTVKPNTDNPDRYVIEEYGFTSELDLIEQMRNGTYASHLVAYNYSTGYYEEFSYNLQENFDNMAHLGSQAQLGKTQQDLSINPTRIMTVLVDHETWNNKETSGSNEERDNPEGNGSNYPDYQKHWLSQSIARRYFMENQKLEIEIAGNMNLTVGDKIVVMLPNMSASKNRDEERFDKENSGTYLISSVSHNSVFLNSSVCVSRVELIRDIYGMKDETSNVK